MNTSIDKLNSGKTLNIAFLAMLIMLGSCQENKAPDQDKTITAAKVETPKIDIHTAVLTENSEVVKQHILAKSNINEKEQLGGSSPLISAALFGKTEIAKMLIDAGADLNVQNNDGSTALITASFFCRPQIVKMLLDKKADKNLKNAYNQTALDAVSGPFESVKSSYEALVNMLGPMGLELDFEYLKKTRLEIADMLQ